MTDPEISRFNRAILGDKRYDRLAVAQEKGVPFYIDENHLTWVVGEEITGKGVEVIVRETANPTEPYWSRTVRDKPEEFPSRKKMTILP